MKAKAHDANEARRFLPDWLLSKEGREVQDVIQEKG